MALLRGKAPSRHGDVLLRGRVGYPPTPWGSTRLAPLRLNAHASVRSCGHVVPPAMLYREPLGFTEAGRHYYRSVYLPALESVVIPVDPWALIGEDEIQRCP